MKALVALVVSTVLPVSVVFATQYVKSVGGVITKISGENFANCPKKIYRKAGQDGLSLELRKQLAIESLKGNTVNDLEAIKAKLKFEDLCTYGADDEKF